MVTFTTQPRILAVVVVVPGKCTPVNIRLAIAEFTEVSRSVMSSIRLELPMVTNLVLLVTFNICIVTVWVLAPRNDTPVGRVIPDVKL